MGLKTFFHHLSDGWHNFWAKEPQIHDAVLQVINGINKVGGAINSQEADIIVAAFGDSGIAGKSVAEIKALVPEALKYSTIASDALAASEGVTDPTEKANAVITTTLTEIAKQDGSAKEAQLLLVIAGIVSKVLHISFTEAAHLVTAKQQQLAHPDASVPAGI